MSVFVRWLKHRERRMFNCIMVVVGGAGIGKSWLAVALGQRLDPKFSINSIIFSFREFLEVVKKQKSCWLVFDEVGLTLDRASHWSLENRLFGHVSESFRKLQINLIMTLPSISMLSRQGLAMVHYIIAMRYRGMARVYENKEWPLTGQRRTPSFGHLKNLNPDRNLWQQYEDKKIKFLKDKAKEWGEVYSAHQLKGKLKTQRIFRKAQSTQQVENFQPVFSS